MLLKGHVGQLDPSTAQSTFADVSELIADADCRNSITSERSRQLIHRSLQLEVSHRQAFAADPDIFSSMRAYDTPALQAAALDLGSHYGNSLKVVDNLKLLEPGFETLDIGFQGVGPTFSHEVSAIELQTDAENLELRTWHVPGSDMEPDGMISIQLAGLRRGTPYVVAVSAGEAGNRHGPKCRPVLMRTLKAEVQWRVLRLTGSGSQTLETQWTGLRFGSRWTISLALDQLFRGRNSFHTTKTMMTADSRWSAPDLSDGIYKIEIEDQVNDAGRANGPVRRGRCWVCVGDWDLYQVRQKLRDKYKTDAIDIDLRFPCALVEQDCDPWA
eukprot:TRINITY_DN21650_c0_g2_i2.p1 TRINITY_DN21650_c0_g2~~TRINITY_DN21650_c0_g2_i2.p1  ORF type:complete len:329 (-),score=32.94 TRINITY_DN21650_c0_g2_i2:125-1111(-)